MASFAQDPHPTWEPIPRITIYYHAGCDSCEAARTVLERVRPHHPFELEEVDLDSDAMAYALYAEQAPAVTIAGQVAFRHRVDEDRLIRRLRQAVEDLCSEQELAQRLGTR
jgi:glutaredoxin